MVSCAKSRSSRSSRYCLDLNDNQSLELAIIEVGNKLVTFFPYQSNDINELPDEISKG